MNDHRPFANGVRGIVVGVALALLTSAAPAVTFNLVVNDSPGEGFNDPVLGPQRIAAFQHAMEALFGVAYTLKFASKLGPSKKDWTVMPLEALWWMKGDREFSIEHKDDWRWIFMIL